ncbi:hypothetical protein BDK51DRAFT_41499 [Blyttiomyces helicus]|uniref:Uncharacterized protein n=1 Tax=Blyttiomyces helicus TaxID=388810 RepID=A0A4P9W234_9FUNG|nr:hypothetical protein BDK51DRAFT_41499 [Blyttiomyces helicus]|eukprot:RKO85435.1 hypothetical protein BDK51DRAFT_41499 [Blyttiomyces helicus]
MPKIVLNPFRNTLSLAGITLRHDTLLDQAVKRTSDVEFNSVVIAGDLTANGNVTFTGSVSEIETTILLIKDNLIDINVGNNFPILTGGFRIQRGPGIEGNLQTVATRQDNLIDGYVMVWNAALSSFDSVNVVSIPFTFSNTLTVSSLNFGASTSSPSMYNDISQGVVIDTIGNITLGSSQSSIGSLVVIPNGKSIGFGSNTIGVDSFGNIMMQTPILVLGENSSVSWGSTGSIYAENGGANIALSGGTVSVNATSEFSIVGAAKITHGGVGMLSIVNGNYQISSVNDLLFTSSNPTGYSVFDRLSINRNANFTSDTSGYLLLETLNDIYFNPATNIFINSGKVLCFGSSNNTISNSSNGNNLLITSLAGSIYLNAVASSSIIIPVEVSLQIGNGTILSEATDGTTNIRSNGNMILSAGVGYSIIVNDGVRLSIGNGNAIVGNSGNMSITATDQLVLSAPSGIQVPKNIPLTFSDTYHNMYQDNSGNMVINSNQNIVFSATGNVSIVGSTLSISSCEIYRDVDGTLALSSGSSSSVKAVQTFLTESNLSADLVSGTGSLVSSGGVLVQKNLIVRGDTLLQSGLNVANVVTIDDANVPINITNSSSVDGTAVGLQASWDTTLGYTLGRGDPTDNFSGRAMLFTIPTFLAYGMGSSPSFQFTSNRGDHYFSIGSTAVNVPVTSMLNIASTSDEAITVAGGGTIDRLVVANGFSAGGGTFSVTDSAVTFNNQLTVQNGFYLFGNGGSQLILSNDIATGSNFYLNSAFAQSVQVSGAVSVTGNLSANGGLTPVQETDAATKQYVDNVARGLSAKVAVIAATVGTSLDLTQPLFALDNKTEFTR